MLELPSCPACEESEIPPPLVFEASRLSGGDVLGLSRCPRCSTYFTRPRLVEHNQSTTQSTFEELDRKYRPEADAGRFHKDANYHHYLDLAETKLRAAGAEPPYRVCDIGAHCGFFLRLARERGFQVTGVEPSSPHATFARERNGIDRIRVEYFDEASFPGETFHLITLLDVLEHIPEPVSLLRVARRKLAPGGLVLAKVPHVRFYLFWRRPVRFAGNLGLLPRFPTFDAEPPDAERDAPGAGFLDLCEHVVHYDREAAQSVFGRAGFENVEVLPAPPTNPIGDRLNPARSLTYGLARLGRRLGYPPGPLTHGLVIVASAT